MDVKGEWLLWLTLAFYAGFWITVMQTARRGFAGYMVRFFTPMAFLTIIVAVAAPAIGAYPFPEGETFESGAQLVGNMTHGVVFFYLVAKYAMKRPNKATNPAP